MSKEILTAEDVAELLAVKPKTVRQWVYQKRIPYFHLGRLLRFRLAAILEWAAQLERAETQPVRKAGKV
jgi:excisionase family DNA binding protein